MHTQVRAPSWTYGGRTRRWARPNEEAADRAGVSAWHTPDTPPRPESPPGANRSLRRPRVTPLWTPDRRLTGGQPDTPVQPDTPAGASRTLRPETGLRALNGPEAHVSPSYHSNIYNYALRSYQAIYMPLPPTRNPRIDDMKPLAPMD